MAQKIAIELAFEGAEDARKQLEALGKAGEQVFRQIADAAKKPISDPAQIDRTKQAMNELAVAARQFGVQGEQATQQITAGLQKTNVAAQEVSTNLISAATAFKVAAIAIAAGISALISSLTTGLGETAKTISGQADKLRITAAEWEELRKRIAGAGLSNDDFAKSAGQASKIVGDAQKELLQLSKTYEVLKSDGNGAKTAVTVFTGGIGSLTKETAKAITELRSFGVSQKALQDPNPLAALRELATIIARMPDLAARAAAGTKFFGDNWKDTVKILADVNNELESDPLKKSRELSAAQVEAGNAARKAWEDFASAVRATKDQIGALFAAGSQAKAEWLTRLVDGSRELFKIWAGLSDEKASTFLAGLGDSPAEQTFKILVAVGQQLAGIWRDILVPAGRQLLNLFGGIANSIGAVTNSQVAAFFITATVAAVGLAVALKGIGLVLSPLATLFSLAFSPLGIILIAAAAAAALFWDQLKAGANSVLAMLPQQVQQLQQALQLLFTGDFAGAWDLFSQAAIAAFEKIKQSLLESEGVLGNFLRALTGGEVQLPWVQTLVNGLRQIGTDLPATLLLIVNGFIALGNAATTAANVINRLFGTQLTGTDVAAILILAQLTGGLQAMASAATIAAAAMGVIIGALGLLATAVGGLPVIIGLLVIALGALIAFNWESFKSDAVAAFDTITSAIGRAYDALLKWLGLRAQAGSTPSTGGGATGSFAGGGLLGGRGSGTSDSNLAWVSRGEHIMPARAVAQPGVLAFLEALRRSGGNLTRVLDGMGRFALGGMVRGPIPAFAGGGLAGGMSNVTIQFPGLPAIGGLRASADVVDQLHRAAALAQVRSGGRKPSRYS